MHSNCYICKFWCNSNIHIHPAMTIPKIWKIYCKILILMVKCIYFRTVYTWYCLLLNTVTCLYLLQIRFPLVNDICIPVYRYEYMHCMIIPFKVEICFHYTLNLVLSHLLLSLLSSKPPPSLAYNKCCVLFMSLLMFWYRDTVMFSIIIMY